MAPTDSIDPCVADVVARYPDIDPDVEAVVERMAAIDKHISRLFEGTLARHGLNHGEYRVLLRLAIAAGGRLSAGDLSRALLLSTGAMTNRLDRLEQAALIRRVPDPNDRRGVLAELTDQGAAVIDRAVTEQARREIEVLGALSRGQLQALNGLLRSVLAALEAGGVSRPAP